MSTYCFMATTALLTLAACGVTEGPVAGEEYRNMPADQVMIDVQQYVTTDGIRRALMKADTALLFEDSARVHLKRVDLTFFSETGQDAGHLTSTGGALDIHTQAMTARGNVVLITREGNRRIETEELHYDPRSERVWSDVETTMQEDGTRVRGEGFDSDAQMKNLRIRRPSGRLGGVRVEF